MRNQSIFAYNPDYTYKSLILLMLVTHAITLNLKVNPLKYIYLQIMALLFFIPFRLLKSIFKIYSLVKGTFIFLVMLFYSSQTLFKFHISSPIEGAITVAATVIFLTSGLNTRDSEWVLLFVGGVSGYIIPLLSSTMFSNIHYTSNPACKLFFLASGTLAYTGFLTAVISNLCEVYVSRETFLKYFRLWGK